MSVLDPLNICLELSNLISAELLKILPSLRAWPYVRRNTGLEGGVDLMITEAANTLAFGQIGINCSIPEDSFSSRLILVKVESTMMPEIRNTIREINVPDFLKKESVKSKNLPGVIISTWYSYDEKSASVTSLRGVDFKFPDIVTKVNMISRSEIDLHKISSRATAQVRQLIEIRRQFLSSKSART